jgi:hypothetical protein
VVSVRRLGAAIVAGAFVMLLGGFGRAADAAPTQTTPSPCKLITTKEAATILDTAVNKGKKKRVIAPPPGAKASRCEWASKKKGVGGIEGSPFKLQVELTTGSGVAGDFEEAKAEVDFEDLETVPDLGTDAFYDDRPFSGVHVLAAEDKVLSVKVTNYDTSKADLPKPPEEMSIDAARIAVGRLTSA